MRVSSSPLLAIFVVLVGCHREAAPVVTPAVRLEPTAVPVHSAAPSEQAAQHNVCKPTEGTEVEGSHGDLDGDGTDDLVTDAGRRLQVYLTRAGCHAWLGTVEVTGPLAFVSMRPGSLVVETWLMHGDRRVVRYRYDAKGLQQDGKPTEIIEGPRP